MILSEEVTFLNKASIVGRLNKVAANSYLVIDGTKCHEIDYDVREAIFEFINFTAKDKNIKVETINLENA